MRHIALIIGNGFDLDLGLLTKYSDFADSKNKEWNDFLNMSGTILNPCFQIDFVNHMRHAREYSNWFDIEHEILLFAATHNDLEDEQIGLIRLQYEMLVKCLRLYIYRQATTTIVQEDSLAYILLHNLNEGQHPVGIYSFNYTDCINLCKCKKRDNISFHPIHGTLFYDMTLGCRIYDDRKENVQLDFMYKPIINPQTDILKQNLTKASEVIVFGHSLNKIDYCYFKDFFDAVELGENVCKHLTFICKNIESEEIIRQNISGNTSLSKTERYINLNFIYTDSWNKKERGTIGKIEELMDRNGIETNII